MNMKLPVWPHILCVLFCGTQLLHAQSVGVSHWTFSGGGAVSANSNYRMVSTVSQPAVGKSQSVENIHLAGFWYPLQRFVTAVDNPVSEIPTEYRLEQNYPNPFNPSTTIRYGLPLRSHVTLAAFNPLGQQVAILQNGEQEAGYHEVRFDGRGLSSGVYFLRIQAGEFASTKRILLIR
jgi:hypothetical protein